MTTHDRARRIANRVLPLVEFPPVTSHPYPSKEYVERWWAQQLAAEKRKREWERLYDTVFKLLEEKELQTCTQ